MDKTMTPKRLEEILATYGAERRRWPEPEREAAVRLLARTPELRHRIDEAQGLDAMLDRVQVRIGAASIASVKAGLEREIAALKALGAAPAALSGGWGAMLWDAIAATWPRAAALASVALLGIAIGFASAPGYSATPNPDGLLGVSAGVSDTVLEAID